MKILIITQIVDSHDPILGFFHRWIEEFARDCENVTVICLKREEHSLPPNVKVLSLGKEEGTNSFTKLRRFYRYIFSERRNYTHVFVHMNPEYVVLGGLFWKILGKRIGLWYVHKSVTSKLKLAVAFCDVVFSASIDSFRFKTPKLKIIGHGIDTAFFSPIIREKRKDKEFHLLSAGRISFSKHHDLLIRALSKMSEEYDLSIVGTPVTDMDRGYENKLKKLVQDLKISHRVHFLGAMDQAGIKEQYAQADLFVHASTTGSYDKVVLEALASGLPVVTSSEAFVDGQLPVTAIPNTQEGFVEGIEAVRKAKIDPHMLARAVQEKHGISSCISQIIGLYKA